MASDGFGVLYSWSRRISRSPSTVLRAVLVVVVVGTFIALDVIGNSSDAR